MTTAGDAWIADATLQFRKYKKMADAALAQVEDRDFFRALDSESNSIALLVKHMAGNLRSRWTDFRTTDGEKPDRRRDTEFEQDAADTREGLRVRWEGGWDALFAALASISEKDLLAEVPIRGEPHTVMQAVHRQLTHYAYHIGQVVFLAKHFAGSRWKTLSIPRGRSKDLEVGKDGRTYRPGA